MKFHTAPLNPKPDYSSTQIYGADVHKADSYGYRIRSRFQGRACPFSIYYVKGTGLKCSALPTVIALRHGAPVQEVQLEAGDRVAVEVDGVTEVWEIRDDNRMANPKFILVD